MRHTRKRVRTQAAMAYKRTLDLWKISSVLAKDILINCHEVGIKYGECKSSVNCKVLCEKCHSNLNCNMVNVRCEKCQSNANCHMINVRYENVSLI